MQEVKSANTSTEKLMFLSKCTVYDSKNSIFIKKQEAEGLLSKID